MRTAIVMPLYITIDKTTKVQVNNIILVLIEKNTEVKGRILLRHAVIEVRSANDVNSSRPHTFASISNYAENYAWKKYIW